MLKSSLCGAVICVTNMIHRLRMMMKSSLCGPVISVTDMIHRLRFDPKEVESMWPCYMHNR